MADSERAEGTSSSAATTTAAQTSGGGPELEAAGLPRSVADSSAAAGSGATDGLPRSVAIAPTVESVTVSCLMNAHYHAGREAFLDTVHRWFMFGVIALGAAALVDIFPQATGSWLKPLFSASAALLGALDLTFDLSNRARMHSMMKRRYFDLLADVREGAKTLAQAKVCLERYSGDEEPPYRVLLLACWNLAQSGVHGLNAKKFIIPKIDLATKNLFRRPGAIYSVQDLSKS